MPRDLPGAMGEFHGGHDGCCAHTPTSSRRRYPERKEPMVIHAMRADDCHFTDFGWLQTYRLFSLSASLNLWTAGLPQHHLRRIVQFGNDQKPLQR